MRRTVACIAAAVLGCSSGSNVAHALRAQPAVPNRGHTTRSSSQQAGVTSSSSNNKNIEYLLPSSFVNVRQQQGDGPTAQSSTNVFESSRGSFRLSATTAKAQDVPWHAQPTEPEILPNTISTENPLRVVIAGGGVGGLLSAKYLKMQGFDVSVRFLPVPMFAGDVNKMCRPRIFS